MANIQLQSWFLWQGINGKIDGTKKTNSLLVTLQLINF